MLMCQQALLDPSTPKLRVAIDFEQKNIWVNSTFATDQCDKKFPRIPALDTFGHGGSASVAGGIHLPCVMLRWDIEFVDRRLPSRKR